MDGEAQSTNFENPNSPEYDPEYWRSSFNKLKKESNLKIEDLTQELQAIKSELDALRQEHIIALNQSDRVIEQFEIVQDELEQVFLSDKSKAREIKALKQQVCEMVVVLDKKHNEISAAAESSNYANQIYNLSLSELISQIEIQSEKHVLKEHEYTKLLDEYTSLLLRSFHVILNSNLQ